METLEQLEQCTRELGAVILSKLKSRLKEMGILTRFEPELVQINDTIHFVDGRDVCINVLVESTFCTPHPELMNFSDKASTVVNCFIECINGKITGLTPVIVSRRLPMPIPGLGVMGVYVEDEEIGIRVLASYDARTLQQLFVVDMIFGCTDEGAK